MDNPPSEFERYLQARGEPRSNHLRTLRLLQELELHRCPHCAVARPLLTRIHAIITEGHSRSFDTGDMYLTNMAKASFTPVRK